MNWYLSCFLLCLYSCRFCSCHKDFYRGPKLHHTCALKKEEGPCKALLARYYFDTDTGSCQHFDYGGCQGNANNFETIEECERTCIFKPDSNPCHMDEDVGPCRGMIKRYFFNKEIQLCEPFFYGGCYGNDNNFKTLGECQAKCNKKRASPPDVCLRHVDEGDGPEWITRFAYNATLKKCRSFHYKGDGGNTNNFASKMDCVRTCIRGTNNAVRGRMNPKPRNVEIMFQSV